MWGCLSMLVLMAAVLAAEWWATGLWQVPHRPLVAGVLAVLATLALSSVGGIVQARGRRARPQDDLSRWQDGATVRVGGVLQAAASPVLAPFSGQPAIYLDYEAYPSVARSETESRWRARWNGVVAVPAVLHTAVGLLPLRGMPRADRWPRQAFDGAAAHARAAGHVASTRWERAPEFTDLLQPSLLQAWPVAGADGGAQRHLMNRAAAQALGVDEGGGDAAALQARLAGRHWVYAEHLLPPGAQVTVVGTYRANPRGIEVGLSVRQPEHGVQPGTAAALADDHWRTTLVGAALLMALALGAHCLVYLDGGAHLRGLLHTLEGLE